MQLALAEEPRTSAPASRQRPMILHVRTIEGAGGGPEKTIANSPRFLNDLGFDCFCAYMRRPADAGFEAFRRRAEEAGAPLVPLDERGLIDWRLVRELVRLCREKRVAIWHGHEYKSNLLGLLVRRFWKMKLVSTVHGWVSTDTWRIRTYHSIDRRALRRYDRVICVSDDLHRECLAGGIPSKRCSLIENAIDTEQFRRRRDLASAKLAHGAPAQGLLLGAAGRLAQEKGFDLLIRAVHRLTQEGENVSLHIAGEGGARPALEALIGELGCGDRVRLLGQIGDVRPFFEALDAFVLSSLREGLPNVLLEAMALETPVISTRVAGAPRLLCDGEHGVLVESGSMETLVAGIRRLLHDRELRRQFAIGGREHIERRYSFTARMAKVAGVYDSVLDDNKPVGQRSGR